MIMFDIRGLIDNKGVLRIPEFINVGSKDDSQGLLYRIERIGYNAFDCLTALKEIQIPVTVTRMEWCFYECHNLERIIVDEANPEFCSIDGVLFSKDKKVLIAYPNAHGKEYCIPEGVNEIGHFAFKTCRDIEIVHLPESVVKIGNNAFYQCSNLKTVFLPDEIKEVGDATEKANMQCKFIYHGESFTFEKLKEHISFK